MADTEWVAVDWGTSNLRVWVFGAGLTLLAERSSDDGMGSLTPEAFEPALLKLIGQHLPAAGTVPVICCGMVGAKQGWQEAPYAETPCAPPGIAEAVRVATLEPRLDLRILPGVKQLQPADVMRGEETQIAGYLAQNPDFDGVICLPGTHTKWVHISAGEIISFRTFMTGELFALLSKTSVLRHSVHSAGWDDAAFNDALNDTMTSPANVTAKLFGLRAGSLLHDIGNEESRARLSGMLIGLELAGARLYWLGMNVVVIGAKGLAAVYASALAGVGVSVSTADGGGLSVAGLTAAYAGLTGETK